MKKVCSFGIGVAAIALSFLPVTCPAQQEQWLEYHTGSEPRGYHWINLSTNAPDGVKLPEGLNSGAMFGRWENGLEQSKGRVLCIARAVEKGSLNRLYVDSNGDGNLADEKAIEAQARSSYGASFPPVKFTFKGEDGPISYHLILRVQQYDKSNTQLLAGSSGWYEGQVDFDGKKQKIMLVDSTLNGVFNDRGGDSGGGDTVYIGGENGKMRFLGDLLEVGDKMFNFEVAKDGAFVKVKKAEVIQLGTVQVNEGLTEFSAVGKNGHFSRKPEKGELKLPVGKYRIYNYEVTRKDEKNVEWRLSGNRFSKSADFVVTADKPVKLNVGEPIRAVLEAREDASRIQFSLGLQGPLGESIDITRAKQRPRAPQLIVADANGKFRGTNTFEYG